MRPNPPLLITIFLAATFAAMALAHSKKVQDRTLQCRIALAALRLEIDGIEKTRPIIVTDGPDSGAWLWAADPQSRPIAEKFAQKWGIPLPDRELERDLKNNGSLVPLKLCANIVQWLEQHHIAHGDGLAQETVNRAFAARPISEQYDAIVVSTSVPALSSDRRTALVATGYHYAPLGGQGSYLEFEIAPDGSVRLTQRYESWVS